jgi:hypothetical protein
MRYPPAISITPAASCVYRMVAGLITIILIALCARSITGIGLFGLKNSLLTALTLLVILWLIWEAWAIWLLPQRQATAQLHFAQGLWTLQCGDLQTEGTLRLHLDLQKYMLVSFQSSLPANSPAPNALTRFFPTTTQWFHLEARHIQAAAASSQGWLAIRRAVHSPVATSHEEWAA